MDRKRTKTLKTQASMIYPGLEQAVDSFIESRSRDQSRIRLATLYAEVLATEFHVCPKSKLGFVKYLN